MEKVIAYQQFSGYEDLFKQFRAGDEKPDLGDDDVPSIVDQLWKAAPVNVALKSVNGASIVFDMSVPSDDVDSDDAPLYKAPTVLRHTSSHRQRSEECFQKVNAKIRAVFGENHPEETEEALALVQKMRAEARGEAISRA